MLVVLEVSSWGIALSCSCEVPLLPDGCQWDEADLVPLREFLWRSAAAGEWNPMPGLSWSVHPIF